jgi:hypothetical protein
MAREKKRRWSGPHEREHYEEYKVLGPVASWIALVLFTAFILGTMHLFFHGVHDQPLVWDFGVLPDTPGESTYSSVEPRGKAREKFEDLIASLPEARPLAPAPTANLGFERGER